MLQSPRFSIHPAYQSTVPDSRLPECIDEAERIAFAIANTVYENWSGDPDKVAWNEKKGGYFCYAWADAYRVAAQSETTGKCFSYSFGRASVPAAAGTPASASVPVHVWLAISTPCGGSVFVDDGFGPGKTFVNSAPLNHQAILSVLVEESTAIQ